MTRNLSLIPTPDVEREGPIAVAARDAVVAATRDPEVAGAKGAHAPPARRGETARSSRGAVPAATPRPRAARALAALLELSKWLGILLLFFAVAIPLYVWIAARRR